MDRYVTGAVIRRLREARGLTQTALAEKLCVSDKAVSRWETGRGFPDITLLAPIAEALGISLMELLSGSEIKNRNRAANLLRARLYVCPICGNVLFGAGEAAVSCCGLTLPPMEPEEPTGEHALNIEKADDEWFVTAAHPMEKTHFISFLAYVTDDRCELVKLYPEGGAQAHFFRRGSGLLYACCNRHGLFRARLPR